MKNNNTGYPHIDKPWMKYYDGISIPDEDPKTNMTQVLKDRNKWRLNKTAYEYYGKKVSYEEMFNNADMASKALTALGVKKGDIILNMVPNIPEEEEIWLGATQIGAISDFIDPRPDSMDPVANGKKLLEIIKHEKPKFIVALDKCYLGMIKPIENELKEMGINDIILLSSSNSMDEMQRLDYLKDVLNYERLKKGEPLILDNISLEELKILSANLTQMEMGNKMLMDAVSTSPLNIYNYNDLVKECKNTKFEVVTDPKLINYIGHTSGTSGARPKPIPITSENAISSIVQCNSVGIGPKESQTGLHILPGFAPFGRFNNDIQSYYNKGINIHIPEFVISEFGYLIKKYKPNSFMAPPAFLTSLPNYKYLENEDLSFIDKIVYGGDAMTKFDEERINLWLKSHGSNAELEKGHGMSEYCGCGTYAENAYNKTGTLGIPLPRTNYIIVDPENEEKLVPLKFKEGEDKLYGEIAVGGPTKHITEGILHDEVIVPQYTLEETGERYIRTRDLGYMDRDGCFYLEERKGRSFARIDGYKIKPSEIEGPIKENPNVKYAVIVPYYDEAKRGVMPMCHIVLVDSFSKTDDVKIVEDIVYNNIINNPNMNSRQIPTLFKIRAAMPINKGGKVDFKTLEKEELTGDEINVVVDETNVEVENIEIFRNEENKKVRTRK